MKRGCCLICSYSSCPLLKPLHVYGMDHGLAADEFLLSTGQLESLENGSHPPCCCALLTRPGQPACACNVAECMC